MFPSKYPGVWKPRKHIKSKGKLFSKAELSWETACCNGEPGSAPQSRGWSRWSGSPPAPTLRACVDSPHFWGRCMWWIAPWPAPMGVAAKNRAPCFPYWRHDFWAPLQLSAVNVYTACSSSGRPLLLTHRVGAQHPLTEHLACALRGRITEKWTTIRQSQRWTIGLGLGGTSRFLSPSFHPMWEYSRYTCSPDSGKTSQIMFQMKRTQFGESDDLISGPSNTCCLTTPSLSFLLNSMGRIVKSPIGAAKGTSKNISSLLHPGTK